MFTTGETVDLAEWIIDDQPVLLEIIIGCQAHAMLLMGINRP